MYIYTHTFFKLVSAWIGYTDALQQNQASFPKSYADTFFYPELGKQYSSAFANSLPPSSPEASICSAPPAHPGISNSLNFLKPQIVNLWKLMPQSSCIYSTSFPSGNNCLQLLGIAKVHKSKRLSTVLGSNWFSNVQWTATGRCRQESTSSMKLRFLLYW